MKKFKIFISKDCKKSIDKAVDFPSKKFKKQVEFLKENPKHPSLHFKRINNYWSVRIDQNYRMLAELNDDELTIFWIGTHHDYDKKIRKS